MPIFGTAYNGKKTPHAVHVWRKSVLMGPFPDSKKDTVSRSPSDTVPMIQDLQYVGCRKHSPKEIK